MGTSTWADHRKREQLLPGGLSATRCFCTSVGPTPFYSPSPCSSLWTLCVHSGGMLWPYHCHSPTLSLVLTRLKGKTVTKGHSFISLSLTSNPNRLLRASSKETGTGRIWQGPTVGKYRSDLIHTHPHRFLEFLEANLQNLEYFLAGLLLVSHAE